MSNFNIKIIIKDAMILCAITLLSGLALGYVNDITRDPIAKANEKAKEEAYKKVFSEADSFKSPKGAEDLLKESEGYLADKGYDGVTIDEIVEAENTDGTCLGYVMTITSANGYGGDIVLTLGIDDKKKVKGMEILSMDETAGLGAKAKEDSFKSQFADKNVTEFEYTKSGKSKDNEIDALSGATITTKAVTGAVNAGVLFADNVIMK